MGIAIGAGIGLALALAFGAARSPSTGRPDRSGGGEAAGATGAATWDDRHLTDGGFDGGPGAGGDGGGGGGGGD